MDQHGPEILGVQQQQSAVIGDPKDQLQDPRLGLIKAHHPGQQQRPHIRNRGSQRVPRLTKNIPQCYRTRSKPRQRNPQPFAAL